MEEDGSRTLNDYGRFVEAGALLVLAKLLVALAPFRAIAAMASWQRGVPLRAGDGQSVPAAIVLAVRRASRRLPIRCVCIHEGLAAQLMLRRRGFPALLHYGARTGDENLAAHVWVSVGGKIVIGEAEAANHACVATFPADAR